MKNTFTTSAGKTVQIQSVPPLLVDEVRLRAQKSVEVPPIPTYEVVLEDGTVLNYEHDDQSIQDDLTPDKDRKLWADRQKALREQSAVSSTKVMELFFLKGVVLDPEELEGDWKELQLFLGIEIPTNPMALRLHYLRTEILQTADDIYGILQAVMEASGVDPVILEAAKRSFRGNLRFQIDALGGSGAEVQPAQSGEVEDQSTVPGAGDSQGLGQDAERVG